MRRSFLLIILACAAACGDDEATSASGSSSGSGAASGAGAEGGMGSGGEATGATAAGGGSGGQSCAQGAGDFDVAFGNFSDTVSDGTHAWIMLSPYGDLNEDAAHRAYVYDPDLGLQKGSFGLAESASWPVVLARVGGKTRAYWIERGEIFGAEIDETGAQAGGGPAPISTLPLGTARLDGAAGDTSGGAVVVAVDNQLHLLELGPDGAAVGELLPLQHSTTVPAQVARFDGTTAVLWDENGPDVWLSLGGQAPTILLAGGGLAFRFDLLQAGSGGFVVVAADTGDAFGGPASLTWFDASGNILQVTDTPSAQRSLATFEDRLAVAPGGSNSGIGYCAGNFLFEDPVCDSLSVSGGDATFSKIERVRDGWLIAYELSTGGSGIPHYGRVCDP